MTAAEAKLLHTVERRRFIDELRHNATRQGSFDCAMWHLDHKTVDHWKKNLKIHFAQCFRAWKRDF